MRSPRLTRRQFVAATAASAFAFTYIPQRAFGANERLNVAGIGVGGKGEGDVNDLAEAGCNIVALCDVDAQRAAGTFARYPQAKHYTDFRVMLEKQQDIDAVVISTPDHMHAIPALMAMRLGKHVYCQKPLTHNVFEARRLTVVAEETGVATQMGNQGHAGEPVRRAVELVRAGIIGPVREVHAWTNRPIWPQGMTMRPPAQPIPASLDWDLWLGPAPAVDYNAAYVPFNWRGWWDYGTGALGDMACHIMDMAFWALDLKYPETIEAQSGGNTELSPPHWSIVTWQFPARGNQPPLKYVWYDGYRSAVYSDEAANRPPDDVLEGEDPRRWDAVLIGDKGRLYFNRSHVNWKVTPERILDDFQPPQPTLPRVANEDIEWIEACKGSAPALSNFSYSGPFTETVLLGNVAIRTGQLIRWDAERLVATGLPEAERFLRREYRKGWELPE